MPTVYVETSVPSFYFETRSSARFMHWRDVTRRWWDQHRPRYELVTSNIVIRELEHAPADKARQMLELIADVPRLAAVPGLEETVRFYLEHQLMPKSAEPDAFHLALVSLHNIDFILTWNIRHLANPNKTRHLQILNGRLGISVPIITTPELLVPESRR